MQEALQHLQRHDKALGRLIRRAGPFAMQYREPAFESLVRSIVYQQLSGKAAGTIYGRFRAATAPGEDELRPEHVLKSSPEELRAVGLSTQKANYIRALAERTAAGIIVFESLAALDDQGVIAHLTQCPGVGVWTAQMFLMFALRRPDVLPTGDLGVRVGMQKLDGLEALPTPAEMERRAERWRPWRSVASWYLWRSMELP